MRGYAVVPSHEVEVKLLPKGFSFIFMYLQCVPASENGISLKAPKP